MAHPPETSRRFALPGLALALALALGACGGHPAEDENDPTVIAVERWDLSLDNDLTGSADVRLAKHANGDVTATGTLLLRRNGVETYDLAGGGGTLVAGNFTLIAPTQPLGLHESPRLLSLRADWSLADGSGNHRLTFETPPAFTGALRSVRVEGTGVTAP